MTKKEKSATIYSGVIIIFGLIVTALLLILFESVEIQSRFNMKNLSFGNYMVTKYEYVNDHGSTYIKFRSSNADVFIEKNVISHESYISKLTFDDPNLNSYYIFFEDESLFTMMYDKKEDLFYLYSGYLTITFEDLVYAIPYIEINEDQFNPDLFKDYESLKLYYSNLTDVIFNDSLKIIRLKAYLINKQTNAIDLSVFKDVIIDFDDQNQIVIELT